MAIRPNTFEILARARNDLRVGIPIVIENTIVASAENIDQNKLKKLQEKHRKNYWKKKKSIQKNIRIQTRNSLKNALIYSVI